MIHPQAYVGKDEGLEWLGVQPSRLHESGDRIGKHFLSFTPSSLLSETYITPGASRATRRLGFRDDDFSAFLFMARNNVRARSFSSQARHWEPGPRLGSQRRLASRLNPRRLKMGRAARFGPFFVTPHLSLANRNKSPLPAFSFRVRRRLLVPASDPAMRYVSKLTAYCH